MPNQIPYFQYTWDMLEKERSIGGKESAEQTLENIAEETEEVLSEHGMSIPNVEVFYAPDQLEENVQGRVSYRGTDELDGMIFMGSESPHRPDHLTPRVSDTLVEEYMHIQFEEVQDFDIPTEMGVDILGSVWSLYSQNLIDNDAAVDEVAYHSKHGYNQRDRTADGYGDMVEEGIYELVEDFREAESERKMMETALEKSEILFRQYNEDRLG